METLVTFGNSGSIEHWITARDDEDHVEVKMVSVMNTTSSCGHTIKVSR